MTTKNKKTTAKKPAKRVKKNLEKLPSLTWPLDEDFQKSLFSYIVGIFQNNQGDLSAQGLLFLEVPMKSQHLRMFQLSYKDENDRVTLLSDVANYSFNDFVLVDKASGMVLIDADVDAAQLGQMIRDTSHNGVETDLLYKLCSISYSALAKFLNRKLPRNEPVMDSEILSIFKRCDFSVVDFSPDQTLIRDRNSVEVKSVLAMQKKDSQNNAVEHDISNYRYKGFTCNGRFEYKTAFADKGDYSFHKPSSVLIKNNSKKGEEYFIFGADEGTYFGCLLNFGDSPKTVEEAFDLLIPVKFRPFKDQLVRQGEWFFRYKGEVPDYAYTFPSVSDGFTLPRRSGDSNEHILYGDIYLVNVAPDFIEVCSYNSITVSAESGDHNELLLNHGVWEIRENTAALSISEKGVD